MKAGNPEPSLVFYVYDEAASEDDGVKENLAQVKEERESFSEKAVRNLALNMKFGSNLEFFRMALAILNHLNHFTNESELR